MSHTTLLPLSCNQFCALEMKTQYFSYSMDSVAPYNTRHRLVLYGPLDPTLCALLLIQHSCPCFNYYIIMGNCLGGCIWTTEAARVKSIISPRASKCMHLCIFICELQLFKFTTQHPIRKKTKNDSIDKYSSPFLRCLLSSHVHSPVYALTSIRVGIQSGLGSTS